MTTSSELCSTDGMRKASCFSVPVVWLLANASRVNRVNWGFPNGHNSQVAIQKYSFVQNPSVILKKETREDVLGGVNALNFCLTVPYWWNRSNVLHVYCLVIIMAWDGLYVQLNKKEMEKGMSRWFDCWVNDGHLHWSSTCSQAVVLFRQLSLHASLERHQTKVPASAL